MNSLSRLSIAMTIHHSNSPDGGRQVEPALGLGRPKCLAVDSIKPSRKREDQRVGADGRAINNQESKSSCLWDKTRLDGVIRGIHKAS